MVQDPACASVISAASPDQCQSRHICTLSAPHQSRFDALGGLYLPSITESDARSRHSQASGMLLEIDDNAQQDSRRNSLMQAVLAFTGVLGLVEKLIP